MFEKQWLLNFTQCYSSGQIAYHALNNILQVTAGEHAEQIGFGYRDMAKVGQSWVLSRMVIETKRLPRHTETIIVRTWIQYFTGSRTLRNFEILLGDEVIVRASSVWVVFNLLTRRADLLALNTDHMVYFPERVATSREPQKIERNLPFASLENYQIRLSDLDIAHHANNVKYMEWCFNAMPAEEVLQTRAKRIEMNFLRELHLGDQVKIGLHQDRQSEQIYCIQKQEQVHYLMQIDWAE